MGKTLRDRSDTEKRVTVGCYPMSWAVLKYWSFAEHSSLMILTFEQKKNQHC